MIKNLPNLWESWVQSLGWEDPLDKGMATHSSILGWESPRTEEPGGLQSMGLQRVRYDLATKLKQEFQESARLQSMGSQTDTTEQLIRTVGQQKLTHCKAIILQFFKKK